MVVLFHSIYKVIIIENTVIEGRIQVERLKSLEIQIKVVMGNVSLLRDGDEFFEALVLTHGEVGNRRIVFHQVFHQFGRPFHGVDIEVGSEGDDEQL